MNLSAANQNAAGPGIDPAAVTLADGSGLDWQAIDALLAEKTDNRLQHWRDVLNAGGESLKQQFLNEGAIEQLVADRAKLVDRLIVHSWESFSGRREKSMALVAVGGYGRGELHPGSDIDLLLLTKSSARRSGDTIASFLAFLWDLGLEVGHSTRSVSECKEACKHDLTVATTLMESRLLCGPEALYDKMTVAIAEGRRPIPTGTAMQKRVPSWIEMIPKTRRIAIRKVIKLEFPARANDGKPTVPAISERRMPM